MKNHHTLLRASVPLLGWVLLAPLAIIFGLIAAVPLVLFFLPAVLLALAPREPAPAG